MAEPFSYQFIGKSNTRSKGWYKVTVKGHKGAGYDVFFNAEPWSIRLNRRRHNEIEYSGLFYESDWPEEMRAPIC